MTILTAMVAGLSWGALFYIFVPGPWNGRTACPRWLEPVERIVEAGLVTTQAHSSLT